MASMRIEVAASSSPFHYVSLRDHNHIKGHKGYIHSQGVRKNGDQDDDDGSWLPSSSHNSTVTSEYEGPNHHHHQKVQNNADDDSWLPTVNERNGKYGTTTNEMQNDFDYSWLPSTFIDNNKNKPKFDGNLKSKNKNASPRQKSYNNKSGATSYSSSNNSNGSPQKKSRNGHWALAREVVFSCEQESQNKETMKKSSDSSRFQQPDSPSRSRYVVESLTSGGVSSLLQRWKDLAETKNSNKNDNGSSSSSNRNNLESPYKEKKNSSPSNSLNDSNAGWDSDASRTRRLSAPLPSRDANDSNLGGAEKEKIRVVDIVKKLSREEELAASHGGNVNASLPPIRTTLKHRHIEGEQKGFKGVKVSKHLVRGRQAFNNFLMQMERDKLHELKWLVERKSVSKFSYRGKIQASLRFKILRLGVEPEPKTDVKRHRHCVSKTLESDNRLDIRNLRERFNCEIEKGAINSRKDKQNVIKNTFSEETPFTSPTKTEVDVKTKTNTDTSHMKQEQQRKPKAKPESMAPKQSTPYPKISCKDVVHEAKFVDSSSHFIKPKEEKQYKDCNKFDFYEDESRFVSSKESSSPDRGVCDSEETSYTGKKHVYENFDDWMTSEYSQPRSVLDEEESYDMEMYDPNYDWISDISRPKSDWEDMRRLRYQEMSFGKADIQRLLQRRSVSSFLGSSLRDVIDQLMVSRVQQSHVPVENLVVGGEKEESRKEEVDRENVYVVDEDCRSRTETKCSEYSEYIDQTPHSERSWRSPTDVVYNSETATTTTSPSLERSPNSNRSHNNSTPQSSSANTHQNIEMELIYDLRGHMEQLHQEIMELRKSIKSCVNMQLKMQHTFKQHVVANAAACSVQKKERKPPSLVKQDCFICGDMHVDSLLYRCGHMCTCFRCAVELQRTSRECPVCEAPIVDVVKAFVHES
uniref:uncharacterized protein LOC122604476 n=1 Tax=Erigeron canadensis TaxID=72917 RepID=UPI001CB901C9|nr:uncharacterized protein LOC122604476 [Erigeron canadensis]